MKHASEFQNYGDYAENCTTSRTMVSNVLNSKKHKFKEVFEVRICFFFDVLYMLVVIYYFLYISMVGFLES